MANWGEDSYALFAFANVATERTPRVEAGYVSGVRSLHPDQHGVRDAVPVEPGHGIEIPPKLISLLNPPEAAL
jgi:hypothetical protein